jgi:lysyl-tRNA synthetase class 2
MDGRADRRLRQRRVQPRLSAEPLSASDLRGRAPGSVRVAGRVLARDGTSATLGDALFAVAVRSTRSLDVAPGDLVIVAARWTGKRLDAARLESRARAPEPRGDGDVARFVFGGAGSKLEARARALAVVRKYFASQRFLEVQTPLLVRAPGVDRNVEALSAGGSYLITSPELAMKRLLTGGVPRLYQLGSVFRADEAGALHEPEFTLLEWYRANAYYDAIIADTEQVVARVARELAGKSVLTTPDGRKISARPPFERIRVEDAFRDHAGISDVAALAEEDEDRYFQVLVDRIEPALAARDRPVFLCDYPISQAALARPCDTDPRFAERFELYAGGIELSNGYGELTCAREQRRRFEHEKKRRKAENRPVYPTDEAFLAALEEGMPPSSGNALGLDRLIALALGLPRISDAIAFPWQGKAPR